MVSDFRHIVIQVTLLQMWFLVLVRSLLSLLNLTYKILNSRSRSTRNVNLSCCKCSKEIFYSYYQIMIKIGTWHRCMRAYSNTRFFVTHHIIKRR
jgi:hypothetical protein